MNLDFEKGNGLIPAIIQDDQTLQVLMLGYMNEEALEKTKETGKVHFFSRSKNRLWMKGETSGNIMYVKSIQVDCDKDTLVLKVDPSGPVCHTGSSNCFDDESRKGFIYALEQIIANRIDNKIVDSYTNYLFNIGINKIAQKVGEEAVELIIEAKDNNDDLFKGEAADLLYHLLILLKAKNMKFEDIESILYKRSQNST